MKTLFEKYVRIISLMFIFLFFITGTVYAKKMESENVNDIKKSWTIKFNKPIQFETVKNNVFVLKVKGGSTVTSNVEKIDDSTVKINPPDEGYKVGETYRIIVIQGVKSKNNKMLKASVEKEFIVVDNKVNTAYASVKVAESLDIFKTIKINSITIPEANTYKIEGSDVLYEVGKKNMVILGEDNPKITFYKEDGVTKLAEGIIDVSKNNDNVKIELQQ